MKKKLKVTNNFFTKNLPVIQTLFDKSNLLVYIKNKDGKIIYKNPEFNNFLLNLKKTTENSEQLEKSFHKDLRAIKKKSNITDIREKYILSFKKKLYLLTNKSIIESDDGELFGIISISRDSTDLKKENDVARYYSKHDPLTGFLNKKSFTNTFQEEISRAIRTDHKLGLFYIDLDNFKDINDNYGHMQGDYILVEVTKRLRKIFRTTDHLGRFGGDEFFILVTNIKKNSDIEKLLKNLIHKINKTISEPIAMDDGKTVVTEVSIGYSYYPNNGVEIKTLIEVADLEMYKMKKSKNLAK